MHAHHNCQQCTAKQAKGLSNIHLFVQYLCVCVCVCVDECHRCVIYSKRCTKVTVMPLKSEQLKHQHDLLNVSEFIPGKYLMQKHNIYSVLSLALIDQHAIKLFNECFQKRFCCFSDRHLMRGFLR